ncbi:hypothetical protein L798_00689 [Zootermopsis nevadensis]|uniref:Uncharacterized protein n=1 Tax=Zootermopsis nevadensis TaxID=136037 RepID=A0A067QKP8_ZOONE|nr:hypothetical protein L798_00689 [Zootermopsis nevadensis]
MACAQDLECEDLTAPEEHFAENDLSFLSPASTCGNESELSSISGCLLLLQPEEVPCSGKR